MDEDIDALLEAAFEKKGVSVFFVGVLFIFVPLSIVVLMQRRFFLGRVI